MKGNLLPSCSILVFLGEAFQSLVHLVFSLAVNSCLIAEVLIGSALLSIVGRSAIAFEWPAAASFAVLLTSLFSFTLLCTLCLVYVLFCWLLFVGCWSGIGLLQLCVGLCNLIHWIGTYQGAHYLSIQACVWSCLWECQSCKECTQMWYSGVTLRVRALSVS